MWRGRRIAGAGRRVDDGWVRNPRGWAHQKSRRACEEVGNTTPTRPRTHTPTPNYFTNYLFCLVPAIANSPAINPASQNPPTSRLPRFPPSFLPESRPCIRLSPSARPRIASSASHRDTKSRADPFSFSTLCFPTPPPPSLSEDRNHVDLGRRLPFLRLKRHSADTHSTGRTEVSLTTHIPTRRHPKTTPRPAPALRQNIPTRSELSLPRSGACLPARAVGLHTAGCSQLRDTLRPSTTHSRPTSE